MQFTIEDHIQEYGSYTVSTATLRPEDLIPAFFDALEEIAPATADVRFEGTYVEELHTAVLNGHDDYYSWDAYHERHGSDAHEYLGWCIEMLLDDLMANAPAGTYFGTLEGDASEFGFWPENS
jgi:hypothetical protein